MDYIQEEQNKIKTSNFNHGLPSEERIEKVVLASDRLDSILDWQKTQLDLSESGHRGTSLTINIARDVGEDLVLGCTNILLD